VKEFVEVESGGRNDRPELIKALAACRLYSATLVIAKFDRLSRNAAFLLKLRDEGVDFIACDMPDANRLTVGIMAVLAEHEREQISARTKAALAVAKRRGVKLGKPEHLTRKARQEGTRVSAAIRGSTADKRAEDLAPILSELGAGRGASLKALARGLNAQGIPAPRGGTWSPMQVGRLLTRMAS
jgi:DNA invertase Pin-like site-specific DNA recombinase